MIQKLAGSQSLRLPTNANLALVSLQADGKESMTLTEFKIIMMAHAVATSATIIALTLAVRALQ